MWTLLLSNNSVCSKDLESYSDECNCFCINGQAALHGDAVRQSLGSHDTWLFCQVHSCWQEEDTIPMKMDVRSQREVQLEHSHVNQLYPKQKYFPKKSHLLGYPSSPVHAAEVQKLQADKRGLEMYEGSPQGDEEDKDKFYFCANSSSSSSVHDCLQLPQKL